MILPGQGQLTVEVLNKHQTLIICFALKFTASISPEQAFT